jgi:hypothetical protein
MKKGILIALLSAKMGLSFAQKIEGQYCEMVEASLPFSKTYVGIYTNDEMVVLLDSLGEKIAIKNISKALNIMYLRGWELAAVYQSNKGGSMLTTYLLRRRKE